MAPWKKAFHVPGNLIKHRIARLLGQFTGGCLDRIIRGGLFPTKDRWIDLRGWAYSLLHPTKSRATLWHADLESSTTDFIGDEASILFSKHVCSLMSELLLLLFRFFEERTARVKRRVRSFLTSWIFVFEVDAVFVPICEELKGK